MRAAIALLLLLPMLALALAQQQQQQQQMQPSGAQLANGVCQAVISIVQNNERLENENAQLKKELMARSAPPEKDQK